MTTLFAIRHSRFRSSRSCITLDHAVKNSARCGIEADALSRDIDFSVRNYSGAPTVLAVECAKLLADKVPRRGYEHIAGKFRHAEDFGPRTVRLFLEESAALDEMTLEQFQTDAFRRVSALLRGMGF